MKSFFKSFFKLIGVAIQWICFLFGSFGAVSVFFNTLLEGPNADGTYYFYLIFAPVLGILISLFGTLMRFILARETKYLPWSKDKKIENNSDETDAPIETKFGGFTESARMRFILTYLSVVLFLLTFFFVFNIFGTFLILSEYN